MSTEYPRPALTADIVPLRFKGGHLEVLLIERGSAPFEGKTALSGGFVDDQETPLAAASRELLEETGLRDAPLLEIGVFGAKDRDPRGWVVSVAFVALIHPEAEAHAGDDAARIGWHRIKELPDLAFDHHEVFAQALTLLKQRTQVDATPLALLPKTFRTAQARHLYSQIWGEPIAPRPFKAWLRRRKVVNRVGPGRFEAAEELSPDWLR